MSELTSLHIIIIQPPTPTLFPYTTLFRSRGPRATERGPISTFRRPVAPVRGPKISASDPRISSRRPSARERGPKIWVRSEEHTSELQSQSNLVCRLLLEKKNKNPYKPQPR